MRKITEEVAAVVRKWQDGEISCEEMIRILTGMEPEIRAQCKECGK